jgi:hypothetical protein
MEARIIQKRLPNGQVETFAVDPATGREHKSNLTGSGSEAAKREVAEKLADTFKRNGLKVTHKEI